ncbi:zinc ribbon domain-containing protein [Halosimplex sp. J119]
MSHGTSESVECPICGEAFDPTAAGGWCTNSDCGEWQHEAAAAEETGGSQGDDGRTDDGSRESELEEPETELDDQTPDAESGTDDAGDAVDRSGDESAETAEPAENGESVEPDEPVDGDEPTDAPESAEQTDGVSAESAASEPASAADAEPDAQSADDAEPEADESSEPDDPSGDHADEGSADETDDDEPDLSCPGCGEAVAADDNFCANCGADVSDLEPGPLTACPSCDADVEPEDNFCASCGEDLDAHRSRGTDAAAATDESEADAGTDADSTGESEAAAGDEAAADPGRADRDVAATESTDDSDDSAGDAPESLVLVVRNREVQVWDGDTVGRTIRSIVMNTGGDEDDALSIHREHVRFDREGGQFHLVALGQNPTVVNGQSLDQDERVPVSPGDRIELSGVATMRVQAP